MLYEYLEYDNEISKRLERLYLYAHINNDLDLTNENYNEMLGNVLNFLNELSEKESYVVPELLEKDFKFVKEYIKKFPKLKEYENNLKSIYSINFDELKQLAFEMETVVRPLISKQQTIETKIRACRSKDAVKNIVISYDAE